jgi:conjugative relaxase-like TrwC/TraI family protein
MRPENISGSQAGTYYFEKDPIFGKGQYSQWEGRLKFYFKLKDPVLKPIFLNLIGGNDLTGNQIIKDGWDKNHKNKKHRSGIDIPFSAPKSVSIMALHAGDESLIDAHHKAIKASLDYMENNLIQATLTEDGCRFKRQTGNGLFAIFSHSISRENDPQLHSHAVLINMTVTDKGYRAISNEEIYSHQRLLNTIYQSELAKNVREAGYEIQSYPDGRWEIAGIKKEWIDIFSKRLKQVQNKRLYQQMAENLPQARESVLRKKVVLESRNKKNKHITESQLRDRWESQVPKKEIMNSVEKQRTTLSKAGSFKEADYTRKAFLHLHKTESYFLKEDLYQTALKLNLGKCTISAIENEFARKLKSGELIRTTSYSNWKGVYQSYYTSVDMINTEKDILKKFKQGKNACKAFYQDKTTEKVMNNLSGSSHKQLEAIAYHILTSKDRYSILLLNSDLDKNHIVEEIFNQCKNNEAHIELKQKNDPRRWEKELWVIDQSSITGILEMNELMDRAAVENARIVFFGEDVIYKAASPKEIIYGLEKYGLIYHEKSMEEQEMKLPLLNKEHDLPKKVSHSLAMSNLLEIGE